MDWRNWWCGRLLCNGWRPRVLRNQVRPVARLPAEGAKEGMTEALGRLRPQELGGWWGGLRRDEVSNGALAASRRAGGRVGGDDQSRAWPAAAIIIIIAVAVIVVVVVTRNGMATAPSSTARLPSPSIRIPRPPGQGRWGRAGALEQPRVWAPAGAPAVAVSSADRCPLKPPYPRPVQRGSGVWGTRLRFSLSL